MEPSDGRQQPASGGRHRAPDGQQAPPRPAGGAHRAPTEASLPAQPARPASAHAPLADERAADLARFLAAARERSIAAPAADRGRAAPAARPWVRRVAAGAVAAVAVIGLGVAVHGLRDGAGAAPPPALAGSGSAPPAGATPTPTPTPTSTPTSTPTRRPVPTPSGPPASSPPMKVREVPVVPVPATANGAAWQYVVTQLFATRSAAFETGRPALLTVADAPGSAVLRADRELYATAIQRAGFTRAEGLGFDLDRVRLLSAASTTARLTVAGRERSYVLRGPAGERVVPAGPLRELTLQLRRSSPRAPWLLAGGAIRSDT